MNNYWVNILKAERDTDHGKLAFSTLKSDRSKGNVYPTDNLVFNAFKLCNPEKMKVVLIGDSPYRIDVNDGLAFSSTKAQPPHLNTMFKAINKSEFKSQHGKYDKAAKKKINCFHSNCLAEWAKQNVLMLNRTLTTKEGEKGSHESIWSEFTNNIIHQISKDFKNMIFLSMVNSDIKSLISPHKGHEIIQAGDPTKPKFDEKCFKKVNKILLDRGTNPISFGVFGLSENRLGL